MLYVVSWTTQRRAGESGMWPRSRGRRLPVKLTTRRLPVKLTTGETVTPAPSGGGTTSSSNPLNLLVDYSLQTVSDGTRMLSKETRMQAVAALPRPSAAGGSCGCLPEPESAATATQPADQLRAATYDPRDGLYWRRAMGRLVVGARGSAKGGAMSADLEDVRHLLWGRAGAKDPVFRSWSQGFSFSPHEPTALVQLEGGPCAVLATVQAFILRSLLLQRNALDWRRLDPDRVDQLLIDAVTHIICQAVDDLSDRAFVLVELPMHGEGMEAYVGPDFFHEELMVVPLETRAEVRHFFATHVSALRGTYGVLLLLYSLLASRGPANVLLEVNDPTEPLIDPEHGYGGQSLINLMLTGRAVSNVWDGDRHIDGMLLRGIEHQSEVGFLTVLERARHCEVGACLKSPRQPVWLLASETHLTVLFSAEKRLAGDWAPTEQARRVFRQFDADGGGFVPRALLPDVLAALGMTADGDFAHVLCEQLDPDGCGVVLESAFLRELCPPAEPLPTSFILYHYNGLSGSAPDGKVVYRVAQALLEDEADARSYEERPPADILGCLQTKWPAIRLRWLAGAPPSLN